MSKTQDRLPVLESMVQVHAITGMPVAVIKAAKQGGCSAFLAGNRIRLSTLLKWFFAEFSDEKDAPPDGLPTWREALNKVQTQRQQVALEKDKGQVIDLSIAKQQAAAAETFYFDELERLVREMPAALSGLSPEQIHTRLDAFVDELRKRSRANFADVGGTE